MIKRQTVLVVSAMLIVCASWCQTDTRDERPVTFPFWMVQEMAQDLNEKDRLQELNLLQGQEIRILEQMIANLERQLQLKDAQLSSVETSVETWKTLYEAEKAKKPKPSFWKWVWRMIIAGSLGFVAGSLAN